MTDNKESFLMTARGNRFSLESFLPMAWGLASFSFFLLALPPIGWGLLIFLVPAFWVPLFQMKRFDLDLTFPETKTPDDNEPTKKQGFFRRLARLFAAPFRWFYRFSGTFYGRIYWSAVLFWLVEISWISFPHPALTLAWIALSMILAVFWSLYFVAARNLVNRFHVPILLAAPIAWMGAEWLRKHFLGGFSFASPEHALYLNPELIQIAEWFGEYGVGGLIVLVGTALGIAFSPVGLAGYPRRGNARPTSGKARILALLFAGFLLFSANYYGESAIQRVDRSLDAAKAQGEKPFRVALLQDPEPLHYPLNREGEEAIYHRYRALTDEAAKESPDLIVWPEGTFFFPIYDLLPGGYFPGMESLSPEHQAEQAAQILTEQNETLGHWVEPLGSSVLVGATAFDIGPKTRATPYNTAFLFGPNGIEDRYDKRRRVIFGEYIPVVDSFPDWFPLKTLCLAIAAGTRNGIMTLPSRSARSNATPRVTAESENPPASPNKFSVETKEPSRKGLVSICFESSVYHFMRSEVKKAEKAGESADFLINITNDGWFRGSRENELHQATYVFRAIENRLPFLVATHGGSSASVDAAGRIRKRGIKGTKTIILDEITPTKIVPVSDGLAILVPFCSFILFSLVLTFLLVEKWLSKSKNKTNIIENR